MKITSLIARLCFLLILMFSFKAVYAQDSTAVEERFSSFSKLLSPEKLYLHTDREVYCVGDTIWFKGYLKNSSQISEFLESNYIYVELFSSMVEENINTGNVENKEDLRERVKIKRIGEGFTGHIKIPENLNTGIAVIRGYSYWMMNREAEYMFSKNIEIRNPMKDDFVTLLTDSKVYENDKYVEIGVENPFKEESKEKADAKDYDIDIQFMPESGRYVVGKSSKIAFKAIDNNGMGVKVKGTLFVDNAESVTFESNPLGMGIINLNLATMPQSMSVKIADSTGWSKSADFPLPDSQAVVMNLKLDTAAVTIDVYSKNLSATSPTWVVVYDASEMYVKVGYDFGEKRYKLTYEHLSPGINNAAVVDDNGNVYASRAFFVYPQERKESGIYTNKSEYKGKEKVVCVVDLKDDQGNPVSGNFSVSVADDAYSPYSGNAHNIVSYMMLGSEISGFVEKPQEYFNPETDYKERIRNMDMLMLSQAWKYYDLPKILTGTTEMPAMGREYTQSISGRVYGLFKTAKKSIVSFIAPSINFTAMGQLDTSGWFALHSLDFPDKTEFIVAASNINGTGKRYTPILDNDIFAINYSYPKYLTPGEYTKEYKHAALSDYYNTGGDLIYSIDPVYITGTRTKVVENISPLPMYEFKEGQYRDEKDLEPYKNYDLYSYIVSTCPPLKYGDSNFDDGDSTLSSGANSSYGTPIIVCRVPRVASRMDISSGWGEIGVFINGIKSSCADLAGLTVNDITGFAYIKPNEAAKFGISYSDVMSPRSIVMIKTKLYTRKASNVASNTPLGWQRPRKTYFPKYDTPESKRYPEEMRSLLYWQPHVNVVDGKARIIFYTSSHLSDYTLMFEGLTDSKEPVSIQKRIVREK